jgi:hypothetical protein
VIHHRLGVAASQSVLSARMMQRMPPQTIIEPFRIHSVEPLRMTS